MKQNKKQKSKCAFAYTLRERGAQKLQKKIEHVRKTKERKKSRVEKQTAGVKWEMITTRRDVIISRLPNRLEPKTTASATGEKPIPSNMRSAKASHRKLKSSMTVRETGWWCGYWQPNGDQGFSHTSARHQFVQKPGSIPSPSAFQNLSGVKKNKTTDNPLSCSNFTNNLLPLDV